MSHPAAKKKGGPCADEPPRRDVAGYAYIYQPEASPIARRAACCNDLTLTAAKSCAQNRRVPAGKRADPAPLSGAFPSPVHSKFRTIFLAKFSCFSNQYFILGSRAT